MSIGEPNDDDNNDTEEQAQPVEFNEHQREQIYDLKERGLDSTEIREHIEDDRHGVFHDIDRDAVTTGDVYEAYQEYADTLEEEEEEDLNGLEKFGRKCGFVGGAVARIPGQLATSLTTGFLMALPKGETFWRGVHKTAMKKWLKKSDGDVFMHYMDGGMLEFEPVEFAPEDAEEPYTRDMWVGCYSGNEWRAPSGGASTYLAHGKIPSMWAVSDATDVGDHVQARVGEALDMGLQHSLYEDATVEHYVVPEQPESPDGAGGGGDGQAVADGGVRQSPVQIEEEWVDVRNPGSLKDVLVPLVDGDGKGQVVSMEKYYETYPEKTSTEEMKAHEEFGRLAEADEDEFEKAKSIVMWAMLGAVGVVGLVVLLVYLMGSGTISL